MTDHSSHTTNALKIPFHHLLFLSFLCGSTDPCPPSAFSRPCLNPPSAVSINPSPSSPFWSPRQFISIQGPPDPRAEESLTRGRRKACPGCLAFPRCPSPSAQQKPGRAALTPAKPASSASGSGQQGGRQLQQERGVQNGSG